jgi:hypothetical protein
MDSALPSFVPDSKLAPSPSREEELDEQCRRIAAENEVLREMADSAPKALPQNEASLRSDEMRKLLQIISDLETRLKFVELQSEKRIKDLERELTGLKTDISWIQESFPKLIAEDRKRIADMEGRLVVVPQRRLADRADVLLSLLAASGGKMMAKDARHKLSVSESQFSQLLASMSDKVETRPFHLDRRQNVILLK